MRRWYRTCVGEAYKIACTRRWRSHVRLRRIENCAHAAVTVTPTSAMHKKVRGIRLVMSAEIRVCRQVCRVTYCTEWHLLMKHIFLNVHPCSASASPRKRGWRFTAELLFKTCQRTRNSLCERTRNSLCEKFFILSALTCVQKFKSKGCRF